MDKYKFIATREEYENFCLEVLGLFAVIMSRVDSARSVDFEDEKYKDLYDVYNRWKFDQIATEFSWSLEKFVRYNPRKSIRQFFPFSIKNHIESLKDPFLKAHEGDIDLNRFHNSPAVLGFKKELFDGLSFNDRMGTVDCWVEYFNQNLGGYYYRSFKATGAPDKFKTNVRTLEKFVSGWKSLEDILPYRFLLYYTCVELNGKIDYYMGLPHFRFIPSKYVRFGQIMHRILTKEETKEFTRKDKYKLKVTHWFEMHSGFEGELVPELSEGIKKVKWKNLKGKSQMEKVKWKMGKNQVSRIFYANYSRIG